MSKRVKIDVAVGDTVMLGTPGVSMPGDWYFGTVLWAGGEDILVSHSSGGQDYRSVFDIGSVRGVGDYVKLRAFQEEARALVKAKRERVDELTQELGKARDAVWEELDRLATVHL